MVEPWGVGNGIPGRIQMWYIDDDTCSSDGGTNAGRHTANYAPPPLSTSTMKTGTRDLRTVCFPLNHAGCVSFTATTVAPWV